MAAKKSSAGFDFIVSALEKSPKAEYAAIKARAEKKGFTVFPVMFGRAKLLLGLVKPSKKKAAKKNKAGRGRSKVAARRAGKRGPGRPRKKAGRGRPRTVAGPLSAVQDLVSNLEDHARENARMRETMEKIREMVERVV